MNTVQTIPSGKGLFFLASLLLGSLLFPGTGCKTVNTVERAIPNARPNEIDTAKFVTDRSLDRKIELISMNQTRVSGDILKVQATLRNKTRSRREMYYDFEWYDGAGMLIPTPAGLTRPVVIQPGAFQVISDVAPSPAAVDFRLKLQRK